MNNFSNGKNWVISINQALFLFIITNRKVTNGVTVAAFGDQPVMDWTVFWRTAPSPSSGWDTGSSSGTWVHTPCLQPRPSMACLPLRSTTFVNKISGKYIKHSFLLFFLAKLGNYKNYFYIYCHLMLKKILTGIWFTQRECERAATSRRSRSWWLVIWWMKPMILPMKSSALLQRLRL